VRLEIASFARNAIALVMIDDANACRRHSLNKIMMLENPFPTRKGTLKPLIYAARCAFASSNLFRKNTSRRSNDESYSAP
jgi:hypothetical protein